MAATQRKKTSTHPLARPSSSAPSGGGCSEPTRLEESDAFLLASLQDNPPAPAKGTKEGFEMLRRLVGSAS
jgi:hypothetical protein